MLFFGNTIYFNKQEIYSNKTSRASQQVFCQKENLGINNITTDGDDYGDTVVSFRVCLFRTRRMFDAKHQKEAAIFR